MSRYSEPIPEDVFGHPESPAIPTGPWFPISSTTLQLQVRMARLNGSILCAGTSPGTGNSMNAVNVMYSRGDAVWYKQRDGSEVPAKVCQHILRFAKLLFCSLCTVPNVADHAVHCLSQQYFHCFNSSCCQNRIVLLLRWWLLTWPFTLLHMAS